MFKKLYLLNLIAVTNLFGAACSNDIGTTPVHAVRSLDDRLVTLSLEFSPQPVRELATRLTNQLEPLDENCDRALLVGEPGTGKTTLAQSLAQRSGCRMHFFRSTMLKGDKYVRSGQGAIDTHLVPIISMAAQERQVVIIDEFDRLIKAKEGEEDSEDRVIHFWQVLDDMFATRNIFFVGTCNQTENFPAPLEDRLPKDCRYHIGLPSLALRSAALKYMLHIDNNDNVFDATITHASREAYNMSLRLLVRAARQAHTTARARQAGMPSMDELLTAISRNRPHQDNIVVRAGKRSIKFLKDNKETITVVTGLAGLGLGVYQHHQSIRRQEQMQLQQQEFQNNTITRNENFTRRMQEDLQTANEQVRKDTQQWQEKYAKEERKQTNDFQLELLKLNHKNTLELVARQEKLQIKLHSDSLQNAKDAAKWQTWTGLGSIILNAGLNYTIGYFLGGKGQESTPASSSDN